jgi:hypothetical protein
MMKAAADSHDGRQQADESANHERRDRADVELRRLKPHFERQAMHPVVLSRPPPKRNACCLDIADRADALDQHQRANRPEKRDVGQRNDELELAKLTQQADKLDADHRPDQAASKQDQSHLHVDVAPLPLRDCARHRRSNDLCRARANGDRGRDARKNQERGDQEAAADAEQSGQKAYRRAHAQEHPYVHRHFRDRQIEVHSGRGPR